MSLRLALTAAVATVCSVTAYAQSSAPAEPPSSSGRPVQSCSAHKFETMVLATVEGKPRSQKITICGVVGQTDADWKRTLEDSVQKVQTNEKMPAEMKQQIVSALKLEIATLGGVGVANKTAEVSAPVATTTGGATASTTIQAMPNVAAPLSPARPVAKAPPRPLERDYGSLQPLPPPLPPVTTSALATSMLPTLASPKIKLFCSLPTDPHGFDECLVLASNTVLTIRADEPLSGDTSLRFVRKGDARGDVNLAAMKKGQTVRIPLPGSVCKGVTRGTVDIEVMRRASTGARQIVDSLGPYNLRC